MRSMLIAWIAALALFTATRSAHAQDGYVVATPEPVPRWRLPRPVWSAPVQPYSSYVPGPVAFRPSVVVPAPYWVPLSIGGFYYAPGARPRMVQ